MRILSIQPTPNPNSMKVTLDFSLPPGDRRTFTAAESDGADDATKRVLTISGVASVFRTADFMAVQRQPSAEWEPILSSVRDAFDERVASHFRQDAPEPNRADEMAVELQTFRRLPMLVKVTGADHMERTSLPKRFDDAVKEAMPASLNMLAERVWVSWGTRYGSPTQVSTRVAQEVDALYPNDRLRRMIARAKEGTWQQPEPGPDREQLIGELKSADWRQRFRALGDLAGVSQPIDLLTELAQDEHFSVRRLALVRLGSSKQERALDVLLSALKDANASVRRTAGDALSDLASPRSIPAMASALQDESKLVRWRAARFLFECGDETAIAALEAAEDDTEFEVRLQVRQAIERIQGGATAAGPAWQQMTADQRSPGTDE